MAGLREPPIDRSGSDFIDAVKRGHIVHDVLERLEADADLEWLLEDAIGRWDQTAPPPEGSEGVEYRAHLREEVESVAHHPAYRAVADLPTARRELGFLRIEDDGAIYQGRVDLAGSEGDRLVLLDVKTTQCTAAAVAARASQYARNETCTSRPSRALVGSRSIGSPFSSHAQALKSRQPFRMKSEPKRRRASTRCEAQWPEEKRRSPSTRRSVGSVATRGWGGAPASTMSVAKGVKRHRVSSGRP